VRVLKKICVFLIAAIILVGCGKAQKVIAPEKGTVSGRVTNQGDPVANAFVLLLKGDSMASGQPLKNATLTNKKGEYKIWMVEPSTYYVVAIKDGNNNMMYDRGADLFGWYGHELHSTIIPDPVVVSEGKDITDIDIDRLIQ
jgi:hypothetical protein